MVVIRENILTGEGVVLGSKVAMELPRFAKPMVPSGMRFEHAAPLKWFRGREARHGSAKSIYTSSNLVGTSPVCGDGRIGYAPPCQGGPCGFESRSSLFTQRYKRLNICIRILIIRTVGLGVGLQPSKLATLVQVQYGAPS